MNRKIVLSMALLAMAGCQSNKGSAVKEKIYYPAAPLEEPEQPRLAAEVTLKPLLPAERVGYYTYDRYFRQPISNRPPGAPIRQTPVRNRNSVIGRATPLR